MERLEKASCICDDLSGKSHDEILAAIAEYDGIVIRSKFPVDRDLLDRAVRLKFIARSGAGMENIDVHYALDKGIKVYNSPEGNRTAVAEHAMGMILSLMNHLNRVDAQVRKGVWLREENRGHELKGKTIALIGYGNMGKALAKRLRGFYMNVLAYDKYLKNYGDEFAKESSWEEIYEQADVISLHTPQAKDTFHLINAERINSMQRPFYLINTARGKNVSIADLLDALDSGKVLGACLDVNEFEGSSFEALSSDEANWKRLIANDKVLLSPHVAGWTHESYFKLADFLYKKIAVDFLN